MKLKNNALQELYDTIVNGTHTISPYETSPIDKDFEKCDEKIQSEIDIWNALEHEARSAIKRLEEDISTLKEHISDTCKTLNNVISERDEAKSQLNYCTHSRDNWCARAKYAEDELERLRKAYDELFDAGSRKISELRRENEAVNKKLTEEVEDLKATLEKVNADRTELQKDRDSYHGLYTELSKTYDKLSEENRKLKARTDCLRMEVEWYRKHYKEKSDKINELKKQLEELTSQYQKLTIENKKLQDGLREIGYEQGQSDLWDKLQNVNDSQPYDFDAECDGMEDVIGMDLEDFLDIYKKWQEEKEKERLDHMRDYLARFCEGRVCKGCPLESTEYKCGCGYSFRRRDRFDTRIIPDEDIKRYYEKARGCGRYTLNDGKLFATTVEGVNRAIAKACEGFCEAVRDADTKITGRIKPNDILEKTNDTDHKLEYGDAVRLPWRDYDYMYIGPDEKEETLVRMFDPKNHAIATSHIGNVRYNGGKIIVCDEDDLRKIWKDKK